MSKTGSEFGHFGAVGPGFAIDAWGSGPFVIETAGKRFRFEDSDHFGPHLCDRYGDPIKNPWPSERSPFWRAHRIWKRQGRRLAEDGTTCIWDEPRPQVLCRLSKRKAFVVDPGEEDGEDVFIGERERAHFLAQFASKMR